MNDVRVSINKSPIKMFQVKNGELVVSRDIVNIIESIRFMAINSAVDKVTRLVIEVDEINLDAASLMAFRELRELIIRGKLIIHGGDIFDSIKHSIEYIYIEKLLDDGNPASIIGLFKGMKKLRKIEFKVQPLMYQAEMFRGCINLDTSNLFREGLISIENQAFKDCIKMEEVILPKSLNTLYINAFHGCKGLKKIEFNSLCDIYRDNISWLNDVTIICPFNFPSKFINNVVKRAKIIKKKHDIDNKLRIRYLKAELLGLSTIRNNLPYNKETHENAIKVIDNTVWRNGILDLFINIIASKLTLFNKIISDGYSVLRLGIVMIFYGFEYDEYNIVYNNLIKFIESIADYFSIRDYILNNMVNINGFIAVQVNNDVYIIDSRKKRALERVKHNVDTTEIELSIVYNCKVKDLDISNSDDGEVYINWDCGLEIY